MNKSNFIKQAKEHIDHYEYLETLCESLQFRVDQLEKVMKIIALKNGGKFMWEISDIENAVTEKRTVTLGGFGIELFEI